MEELLFDPQTSGGLLVSLPAEDAEKAAEKMRAEGMECAVVGEIVREENPCIRVCP